MKVIYTLKKKNFYVLIFILKKRMISQMPIATRKPPNIFLIISLFNLDAKKEAIIAKGIPDNARIKAVFLANMPSIEYFIQAYIAGMINIIRLTSCACRCPIPIINDNKSIDILPPPTPIALKIPDKTPIKIKITKSIFIIPKVNAYLRI